MCSTSTRCLCLATLLVALYVERTAWADDLVEWKREKAGAYLDERAQAWFEFSSADRGEGNAQTSCVCCHTLVPYALARPVLRNMTGTTEHAKFEKKLLAQTKSRVQSWANLDTAEFGLLYDDNDLKKKESWGTEAVLNAVILAFDDQYQGQTKPSDVTYQAFANLWKIQTSTGGEKGSWDWLTFKFEPWESKGARYYGAALAAVAVGTAPGYYTKGENAAIDAKVDLLRGYLKSGIADQSLYNRAWSLWASLKLDGVLTKEEQKKVVDQLLEKQRDDGGWSLASLGSFVRSYGTAQETFSDGYATGLVLHVLQTAGVMKDNPRIAQGLTWLRTNQATTGEWRGVSVNKKRNPGTHVGKFMSDAATAYAVLALSH
jgi:squalene-hopene/tetraprenyl-beta-curcumene cyclase